ncbi:MAG: TRAP transporter small permease [Lachnospiraceae bacterium]|nr:TRAP transporter small permease [Lachnospiraceae bacterium]
MEKEKKGRFLRVMDGIGSLCEIIGGGMMFLMILLITVQVVLRFLGAPLLGIEELLNFPTIWMYFLGGACASFTNTHIECGAIEAFSKNKKRVAVANVVKNVITSAISVYVLIWAAEYTRYSFRVNKISALLHIPMPLGEAAVITGLVLMAVFTILTTIRGILELRQGREGGGTYE